MIKEIQHVDRITRSECHNLLIEMLNEYIDTRNQIFDSCCLFGTDEIYDAEDEEYLLMMDVKIQRVLDFLE